MLHAMDRRDDLAEAHLFHVVTEPFTAVETGDISLVAIPRFDWAGQISMRTAEDGIQNSL
ncbi:MAG: hypothetical protein C5B51_31650 [Terriglobia bacterium]|nr:MAG: hypothetical protein C5B51_31650 [Terriglobia bacterium]